MNLFLLFILVVAAVWVVLMIFTWFAVRKERAKIQNLESANQALRKQLLESQ